MVGGGGGGGEGGRVRQVICRLLLAGGLGRLKDMQLKYIYKLCQFLPHPLGKNNVFGFFFV